MPEVLKKVGVEGLKPEEIWASIMSSLRTIDIFLQLQMKFVHVNIIIGSLLIVLLRVRLQQHLIADKYSYL